MWRFRCDLGFSFTRISPLFCSVAKSPSSAPVRLEDADFSGSSLTFASICLTSASVSLNEVPAGVR